jgi:hypothetical protein
MSGHTTLRAAREERLGLWRRGFEAGQASERRRHERDLAGRSVRRDLGKFIHLIATTVGEPMANAPDDLAGGLLVIAAREMPCTCLPAYTARGRVDPLCRHDMRDDLVAGVVAYVNRERDRRAGLVYPSRESRRWGLTADEVLTVNE